MVEIGRAREEEPAIAPCSAASDHVGVDCDDATTAFEQLVHRGKPRPAEADDTDVALDDAVQRRQPGPRGVVPDRTTGQLIPTRPFTEAISGAGS